MKIHSNPVGRTLTAAAAVAALALGAGAAQAQDVSFKGKQFKVIIGYAPGGGYDLYARTMARHIGKHLPGNPKVISQNIVGAGSMRAVNYLYTTAPKDGTQFGTFSRGLPLLAFSGGDQNKVRFDPLKLTWIGTASSYANDAYLMAVRKDAGVGSIKELRTRKEPLNFASTGFGSTGHDIPLILKHTLGVNLQVVHGYPGGSTLYLAVNRGEMDGRMVGYSSVKSRQREWLEKDSPVKIMLQFARQTRHQDFPDVPTAQEMARSQADKDLIAMMEAPYFMARPFAGPPDIPKANAEAVRDAFMAAHADPEYMEEAKNFGIDVSPKRGDEIQKVVERIGQLPKELYDRYNEILSNPDSKPRQVNWQIVEGEISELGKKGRLQFKQADGKTYKTRMRKRYTEVSIDGKEASRKAVKAGMDCKIWYEGDGSYAGKMECTN